MVNMLLSAGLLGGDLFLGLQDLRLTAIGSRLRRAASGAKRPLLHGLTWDCLLPRLVAASVRVGAPSALWMRKTGSL